VNVLAVRVAALETAFRAIESGRMRGLPMLHPGLAVQAVDFEADLACGIALGVLVTPWFMNLMRLPLRAGVPLLAVGETGDHETGTQRIGFIGAHEPAFGAYEACSLFSPMAGFADQAAAVATARQVMQQLRGRPATLPPQQPARRGFLFGRSGAAA
jgi:[NiFe] hydrogenase assembly HybE family chaperone